MMNYKSVKEITDLQLKRITSEQNRTFNLDRTRIVTLNGQDIGFYVVFFICGRLTLEYYLFKEYQHKGLGPEFVKHVTDFAGQEYPNFSNIYLLIYHQNIPSLKVAQKNGYSTQYSDYEFYDIVSGEAPDYHLYSKSNIYYKSPSKSLVKKKEAN